ncbi:phthiocerol/phthiodiolone dimycocerosyl transferase family protein [Secundilactobacillus yichangensis]|uniref:phthiocerol/phthiodiolone dimycocerosyl transferase family protein n=1 Tax=Secundilactobacillus yichangensis TaxID=2799580 RepID=UPI00194543C4|nr:condensation domain-containing protein [Secundilactobacillus yichangensis]
MARYDGEPLNILHTIGLKILYPVVRVSLHFNGLLDRTRFEGALDAVSTVVPELLCRYDLATNQWVQVTDQVSDLILDNVSAIDEHAAHWDLMTEPQLRVYWNQQNGNTVLTLYISHILTDGAGSKQLLYLLAQAYKNGSEALSGIQNLQDVSWLEQLIKEHPQNEDWQTDHPAKPLLLPKLDASGPVEYHVGRVALSALETKQLIQATHAAGVTVNDVVMGSFGRIMQQFSGTPALSLACPTDMRQFTQFPKHTTQIANMTSRYNFSFETDVDTPLLDLIQQVHQEMAVRKEQRQCLDSVASLLSQYHSQPLAQLQQTAEDHYHVREIAYTNFGIIDAKRLQFGDVSLDDLVMTGGFRRAPMYQIAAGTFDGQLSLAFNMQGTATEKNFGMALARDVANAIRYFTAATLAAVK